MSGQQPCRKTRKFFIAGTDSKGSGGGQSRPSHLRLVMDDGSSEQPQPIRLLLVEDSPFDAELFREQLDALDGFTFDVCHCETLADALASLASKHFDVVILDLTLPDSSDYNSFKRVHENANSTPIIILTGLDERSVSVRALEEGAANYLIKNKSSSERIAASIMTALANR